MRGASGEGLWENAKEDTLVKTKHILLPANLTAVGCCSSSTRLKNKTVAPETTTACPHTHDVKSTDVCILRTWTVSACDGNMLRHLSLVMHVVEYTLCQCQGVCTECILLPSTAASHVTERSSVSVLERLSIRIISLDIHGPLKNFSVPLTQWDCKQIFY